MRPAAAVAAGPGLRLAAEIDRAVALRAGRRVPLLGRVGGEIAVQRLRQRRRRRVLGTGPFDPGRRAVVRQPLAPFEERVLLHLGVDEVGQFEIGQLQHLDRLLQLRRHDQRLRLAQLKALRKTRPVHITLRSERVIG